MLNYRVAARLRLLSRHVAAKREQHHLCPADCLEPLRVSVCVCQSVAVALPVCLPVCLSLSVSLCLLFFFAASGYVNMAILVARPGWSCTRRESANFRVRVPEIEADEFQLLPAPTPATVSCLSVSPACLPKSASASLFVLRPGRLGCLGNVCLEMSAPHAARKGDDLRNMFLLSTLDCQLGRKEGEWRRGNTPRAATLAHRPRFEVKRKANKIRYRQNIIVYGAMCVSFVHVIIEIKDIYETSENWRNQHESIAYRIDVCLCVCLCV